MDSGQSIYKNDSSRLQSWMFALAWSFTIVVCLQLEKKKTKKHWNFKISFMSNFLYDISSAKTFSFAWFFIEKSRHAIGKLIFDLRWKHKENSFKHSEICAFKTLLKMLYEAFWSPQLHETFLSSCISVLFRHSYLTSALTDRIIQLLSFS